MLVRFIRRSIAASRHFSAQAAAEKVSMTGSPARNNPGSGGGSGGGCRDTLGKRLLSLVYPKRSAVIAIRKWKEEGRTVRKYELNRVVRELRKLKRYKHALEVCEWMTLQKDTKLQAGDYAVHLDLISKVRGINSAEKFFEDLPDRMKDLFTCSALLHNYVQNNLFAKAEALMGKMSECGLLKNPLPYNHMLSLYISNGQLEKVPGVIEELKKNTSPDIVTYNLWLTVSASQNDVESAEKVLLELKKAKLELDWVTNSTLTNLYIKSGFTEKAASTLKEMEKMASRKNRVAYSSLLSLHTNMGDKEGVHRIWKKMKSCFRKMNDAEYNCMISSLLKLKELKEAENLYTEWESVSGTGDVRVSNLLLAAYVNRDQMEMADKFYDRMVQKGISPCYTTWELLTWGYLKQKQMGKVLEYFEKAVTSVKKWDHDEKLVREVFKMIEEQGDVEGAEELLGILRNAGYVSTRLYNSLLRTYAKAGKMPLLVEERMEKDHVQLDQETRKLIKITSKMCVSEVSSTFLKQ
ncbi:Tetratricopeptide-like helical domain containing protein [Parasponia andersonii]|uniref:Tetratricopeptide-like helical domain containing protein n=1 Tax=Parasponia andersonii TaxID=3476 RepID=A0A2P5CJ56_PARAD|nr:Tetratricopeptide-like helical domain containing protein [Parasponia andersonii]